MDVRRFWTKSLTRLSSWYLDVGPLEGCRGDGMGRGFQFQVQVQPSHFPPQQPNLPWDSQHGLSIWDRVEHMQSRIREHRRKNKKTRDFES
ncbi:unnamed protein product, partial [Vitis vinifera]|uniref:Uncharacterized protein n=1 Tax=Vitis vinifera TaxID=29760 RepID=D7SNY9_VITVI